MLSKAFDDPNQPLYMMCEKIFLGRIAAADYVPYIQEAAKIRWAQELDVTAVERIIALSETHPFYVNFLCSKLWQKNNPPLKVGDVDARWQECLISEERRLIEELDKLTINQRLVLKEIAQLPNLKAPTATAFLNRVKMPSGTVTPILKALEKKDMLYVDQSSTTKVLDPLLKYLLVMNRANS